MKKSLRPSLFMGSFLDLHDIDLDLDRISLTRKKKLGIALNDIERGANSDYKNSSFWSRWLPRLPFILFLSGSVLLQWLFFPPAFIDFNEIPYFVCVVIVAAEEKEQREFRLFRRQGQTVERNDSRKLLPKMTYTAKFMQQLIISIVRLRYSVKEMFHPCLCLSVA